MDDNVILDERIPPCSGHKVGLEKSSRYAAFTFLAFSLSFVLTSAFAEISTPREFTATVTGTATETYTLTTTKDSRNGAIGYESWPGDVCSEKHCEIEDNFFIDAENEIPVTNYTLSLYMEGDFDAKATLFIIDTGDEDPVVLYSVSCAELVVCKRTIQIQLDHPVPSYKWKIVVENPGYASVIAIGKATYNVEEIQTKQIIGKPFVISGSVTPAESPKNVGPFNVPFTPEEGGTISGASYSVSSDNPDVMVFFTDTETSQTTSPSANVVASLGLASELAVLDAIMTPAKPVVGEEVNIAITVENQGNTNSGAFRVDWYADPFEYEPEPPPAGAFGNISESVPSLAPGQQHTIHSSFSFPAWQIAMAAYARVDTTNAVLEFDEDNNLLGPLIFSLQKKTEPCVVNTIVDNHDGNCDTLHCSLREAVEQCEEVSFHENLTGQTIGLSGKALYAIGKLSIDATSTPRLIVNGKGRSRVLGVGEGSVSIKGLTITGGDSVRHGGGILIYRGSLVLTNSTVRNNKAELDGGGIYNDRGGLTLINSTVSANSARGAGGAIASWESNREHDVTMIHSTIANNSARSGGGIARAASSELPHFRFVNTLIANNTTNCGDHVIITFEGNNLSSDGTCTKNEAIQLDHRDIGLGPLQNNGGPTPTHALLFGSQAIDRASGGACESTDQRGIRRPQGEGCDIGAYEFIRGDLLVNGIVDLEDLNILLSAENLGKRVDDSVCGEQCDLNDDGWINIVDARRLVRMCTFPRCTAH